MAQANGEPPLVVAVCDLPTDLLNKAEKAGKIRLLTWRRGPDTPRRQSSADRAWLEKNARGASALVIIITEKIDDKFLDTIGPSLKVIATMSVGYNHIDTDATSRRGIRVGYTPNVLNDAVADVALILALNIMRHTRVAQSIVSSGKWPDLNWTPMAFTGPALQGKTIGFLGFGGIAQTVVSRLVSFTPARVLYTTSKPRKMDLKSPAFSTLANDPIISAYVQVHGKLPFEITNEPELHKLASECDVIFVLTPLSEQTEHIVNFEFLRAMKRTAYLVNVSRGPTVDTSALVEALRYNEIAGAALDVLEGEPGVYAALGRDILTADIPTDHPLLAPELESKVVLYPHIGSSTVEARRAMSSVTEENVLAGLGIRDAEKKDEMVAELIRS